MLDDLILQFKALRRLALDRASDPVLLGRLMARTAIWPDSIRPGEPVVLCLARSQFEKDLDEMRRLTPLNFVTVRATLPKTIQERWIAPEHRIQANFANYIETTCRDRRPTLERFATAFIDELCRKHPIDAVLSANIDYWQDEAIKIGCAARGIPFLTLCRENYTIPCTMPYNMDYYEKARFTYRGAAVAVFSDTTRGFMLDGARIAAPDVWVTGAPRFDRWLEVEPLPLDRKSALTLIAFNGPLYWAPDTFAEILGVFADRAKASPRPLDWVVKVKKGGDMEDVRADLRGKDGSALTFDPDASLYELFPRSRAVVSFNSLATIEALLADSAVIIPVFGQTDRPRDELLIDPRDELSNQVFHFARSAAELDGLLARAAAGDLPPRGSRSERRAMFSRHFFLPEDGTASRAVERFIRHYIGRAKEVGRAA